MLGLDEVFWLACGFIQIDFDLNQNYFFQINS